MSLDLDRCVFCGAPARELHHPTCRPAPELPYLDPTFTVPVCVPSHHAEHAAWRDARPRLDRIDDPLLARVRRTTWFWGRLADRGCEVVLGPGTLRGLHRSGLAVLELVLARMPGETER